jgi:hypothetical protein
MRLELSDEERSVLLELVREAISDIKSEVRHTMTSDFKESLKQREGTLVDLQEKLGSR